MRTICMSPRKCGGHNRKGTTLAFVKASRLNFLNVDISLFFLDKIQYINYTFIRLKKLTKNISFLLTLHCFLCFLKKKVTKLSYVVRK